MAWCDLQKGWFGYTRLFSCKCRGMCHIWVCCRDIRSSTISSTFHLVKECEKSKRNVDIYIYIKKIRISNCIHIDTYILTLQTTFSQEMLFRVLLKSFIFANHGFIFACQWGLKACALVSAAICWFKFWGKVGGMPSKVSFSLVPLEPPGESPLPIEAPNDASMLTCPRVLFQKHCFTTGVGWRFLHLFGHGWALEGGRSNACACWCARLPSVLHVLQVHPGVEWHGEKAMLTWTRRKGWRVQDPTGGVWWDMIELCM